MSCPLCLTPSPAKQKRISISSSWRICPPQQASVRAIVADYSERYPGLIKYFENESNLGYDANLRRIFELADGEYCFFMGNDDLMCPDALSHVTSLLRRHAEVGVVMRSYAVFVGSSNNITQEFRYFAQERFFPAGVDTIVTFFRRMVVLPGIVIHRRTALRCATDRYDGTLLYQLYLVGRILTQMNGVFSPEITALYRGGGTPDFGNSTAEQGRFVPGDRTPESSLHFMSGMLQIAKGLADEMSLPVYEPILRDLSNYSYPFIAVQRHRPVGIYATYCYRLARLGFGKYPLFYVYAFGAAVPWYKRGRAHHQVLEEQTRVHPNPGWHLSRRKSMRVVVAGDWHSSIHEQPAYEALIRLGHEARRFSWHGYFRSTGPAQIRSLESAWKKIQNKYLFGPLMARLNRDFVASVVEWRPELLFVYRGTHITKATLENIRKGSPETFLIGYNNDDPFSPTQPHWAWRHFLAAVPAYDLMLAYRHRNIADFRKVGAKEVRLLRSWFVPEINHPVELQPNDKASYESDVVFIGHYEADNRLAYLDAIAAMGIKLRVFGPEYPNNLGFKHLKVLSPIRSVRGEEYNKALCGAKIALASCLASIAIHTLVGVLKFRRLGRSCYQSILMTWHPYSNLVLKLITFARSMNCGRRCASMWKMRQDDDLSRKLVFDVSGLMATM